MHPLLFRADGLRFKRSFHDQTYRCADVLPVALPRFRRPGRRDHDEAASAYHGGCHEHRSACRATSEGSALVGFGAVFLISYAVTHDDDDEFITVISPAAGATVWGTIGAGVGALAGWGIGRNRDDGYRDGGGSDLTTCWR
ncbi:MAG: hypothetical protein LC753_02345 [Acidobacteria bacterium]|nr:hypothetical protein [Acidobacteriota bacterium]